MNLSCGFYCQFLFTIAYCRYDGDNLYLDLSARYISDFNPHPPMRGMTGMRASPPTIILFQSTSPYAGDDPPQVRAISTRAYFNPHPPMRGMTYRRLFRRRNQIFQSTSPYAGDDIPKSMRPCHIINFNPRPPHGGRQNTMPVTRPKPIFQSTSPARGTTRPYLRSSIILFQFQSTSPARGTTCSLLNIVNIYIISIHVPRTGDDRCPL